LLAHRVRVIKSWVGAINAPMITPEKPKSNQKNPFLMGLTIKNNLLKCRPKGYKMDTKFKEILGIIGIESWRYIFKGNIAYKVSDDLLMFVDSPYALETIENNIKKISNNEAITKIQDHNIIGLKDAKAVRELMVRPDKSSTHNYILFEFPYYLKGGGFVWIGLENTSGGIPEKLCFDLNGNMIKHDELTTIQRFINNNAKYHIHG